MKSKKKLKQINRKSKNIHLHIGGSNTSGVNDETVEEYTHLLYKYNNLK